MIAFRALLIYLLIGMIIQLFSIRTLTKKLNTLGWITYIFCGCLWPFNIIAAIYNEFFASQEYKDRLDDAYDIIEKNIFEEDP